MFNRPNILTVVNSALKKDQEERREMLLIQLHSLCLLLHQGLAIRGHSGTDEGNRYQLMSKRILQSLLSNIKSQHFFSE